jgi:hypothetical protein
MAHLDLMEGPAMMIHIITIRGNKDEAAETHIRDVVISAITTNRDKKRNQTRLYQRNDSQVKVKIWKDMSSQL